MILERNCRICQEPFTYEVPDHAPLWLVTHDPPLGPSLCPTHQAKAAETEVLERRCTDLREHNIPLDFWHKTFDDYAPKSETQAAALLATRDEWRHGVYLSGAPGTGKTHLACAALMSAPCSGLFVTEAELMEDVYRSFSGAGTALFDRACRVGLLVLDEMGRANPTPTVRDRLHSLLNERMNWHRPIIVTTNCSPEVVREHIGEAGLSRLTALCAKRIEVVGPDGRRAT